MELKVIKKESCVQKRVLMRVDFNVEFDPSGKPKEKYKIQAAKESIELVSGSQGAKLALLSHLGRPEGKDEKFSFNNFYREIGSILGKELVFCDDCIGEKIAEVLKNLPEGKVLMLENVRFYKEDMEDSEDFARKLAANFDIFINEAFGASHREHASITGITKILPSFAGLNFEKEVRELSALRDNFGKPAIALIGGAKIETKVPVINFFAEKYENVLAGGKIGIEAQKQGISFPQNVLIPVDYQEGQKDIGPKTIQQFSEVLSQARTIIWNGPMGLFEEKPFDIGTDEVLKAIIKNEGAYKVAGGGETVQVLEEDDLIPKFNFVSTGGGAMLEFLAKGSLPGIDCLYDPEKN